MDQPRPSQRAKKEKKLVIEKSIIAILLLLLLPRRLVIVNIFPPKEEVGLARLFIAVINSLMSFLKLAA